MYGYVLSVRSRPGVRRKEGKTKNAAGERMCTLVRSRPGVRRKEGKTKNAAGEGICTLVRSRPGVRRKEGKTKNAAGERMDLVYSREVQAWRKKKRGKDKKRSR